MTYSTVQTQQIYALATKRGEKVFIGSGSSDIEQQAYPKHLISNEGYVLWRLYSGGPKVVSTPGLKSEYYQNLNSGAGGTAPSTAGGAAPGAAAAVSAFNPQPSGSHVGMARGPVEQGDSAVVPTGAFIGINTSQPEQALRVGESPSCRNVHGAKPLGSIVFRRGCAKLLYDIDTVAVKSGGLVAVATASLTASTNYLRFTLPDTTTHAFWFDTTGGDSEPAGSSGADDSTKIVVTGFTAAQVAAAVVASINSEAIGLYAYVSGTTMYWIQDDYSASWSLSSVFPNSPSSFNSGVIPTGYGGTSIEPLTGDDYDGEQGMLLTFQNPANGYIGTAGNVLCVAVQQKPLFGRQRSLRGVAGPTLTPADAGSQVLQATVSHPRGSALGEVVAVTIRYSTRGFPIDVDGNDDNSKAGSNTIDPDAELSGFLTGADRGTWDGSSQAFTKTVAAGTYYVTAWAHSREGTTRPTRGIATIS